MQQLMLHHRRSKAQEMVIEALRLIQEKRAVWLLCPRVRCGALSHQELLMILFEMLLMLEARSSPLTVARLHSALAVQPAPPSAAKTTLVGFDLGEKTRNLLSAFARVTCRSNGESMNPFVSFPSL